MAIKITPVETDGPVSVPVVRKTIQTPPEAVSVAPDAPAKRPRGFAAMSPEKRQAAGKRGGDALKDSYPFQNRDLAVAAGRAGGKASKRKKAVQ
jgi:general stress protein YciG